MHHKCQSCFVNKSDKVVEIRGKQFNVCESCTTNKPRYLLEMSLHSNSSPIIKANRT